MYGEKISRKSKHETWRGERSFGAVMVAKLMVATATSHHQEFNQEACLTVLEEATNAYSNSDGLRDPSNPFEGKMSILRQLERKTALVNHTNFGDQKEMGRKIQDRFSSDPFTRQASSTDSSVCTHHLYPGFGLVVGSR